MSAKSCASISVVDLFTIGIGPSSSHTVGPMRAAYAFAQEALAAGAVARIECHLYGSLALTGRGHATDTAIILGLSGWLPEVVDPNATAPLVDAVRAHAQLSLSGKTATAFIPDRDIVFHLGKFLPGHANAMRFVARYGDGGEVQRTYFSIGGGAVQSDDVVADAPVNVQVPYAFASGAELLTIG